MYKCIFICLKLIKSTKERYINKTFIGFTVTKIAIMFEGPILELFVPNIDGSAFPLSSMIEHTTYIPT